MRLVGSWPFCLSLLDCYSDIMKVLFICRANVGRSQAAMEFYNLIAPGQAASAGTKVDHPGEQLKDRPGAAGIIAAMKDYGVDMLPNVRTQVTEAMLADYDRAVVMAEPETVPDWLAHHPKTVMWTVEDSKDKPLEKTREIARDIKRRVEALAASQQG
jgi:protein-tyrosine-phosphatase